MSPEKLYWMRVHILDMKSRLHHTKLRTIKALRICNLSQNCKWVFLFRAFVSHGRRHEPGPLWGVASLLNSAAVVLWRHLGNRGNWRTYPVTLAASETAAQGKLIWAQLCSLVRRLSSTASSRRPGFTTFHMCCTAHTWTHELCYVWLRRSDSISTKMSDRTMSKRSKTTHKKSKVLIENNTLQSQTHQAWLC